MYRAIDPDTQMPTGPWIGSPDAVPLEVAEAIRYRAEQAAYRAANPVPPAAPLPPRDWHVYQDDGSVDGRTRHVAARRSEEDAAEYVRQFGGWYRHEPREEVPPQRD